MNEPKKPAATPEEYPLVISFLREDVQDLRQGVNQVHQEVNEHRKETRQDINEYRNETRQDIAALRQDMAEMARRFESRFNWIITSLIGLGTLMVATAGVVVAILRP